MAVLTHYTVSPISYHTTLSILLQVSHHTYQPKTMSNHAGRQERSFNRYPTFSDPAISSLNQSLQHRQTMSLATRCIYHYTPIRHDYTLQTSTVSILRKKRPNFETYVKRYERLTYTYLLEPNITLIRTNLLYAKAYKILLASHLPIIVVKLQLAPLKPTGFTNRAALY